jgi:hypothetical protein
MRARPAAAIAVLGMLAPLGATPAGASGTKPLVCQAFGVSPDAQPAVSAMCVTADITRDAQTQEETSRTPHVYVSRDGGHTWTSMRAVGLPPIPSVDAPPPGTSSGYTEAPGTTPVQVVYSAGYAVNHTIYLAANGSLGGVYQSTDEGDTWTLANPTSSLAPAFVAYSDPRPTPGNLDLTRYPLALADRVAPDRIDGPATTQEKGANPAYSRFFAFAPRPYRGLQLLDAAEVWNAAANPPFSTNVASLRSCSLDLDCSTVLHTFPTGSAFSALVLAGDFDRTGLVLIDEMPTAPNRPSLGWLASTDGGRSFRPWTFVTLANRDVARRHGENTDIVVATNPHRPGMLVASVAYDIHDAPRQRMYVSHDDGRRWTLTSDTSLSSSYEWPLRRLVLGADGRLFELADVPQPTWPQQDVFNPKQALWCSADTGHSWSTTCPH